MPLIPLAMALAQFAPLIAGWLGGSKAADVATKVVGIAQTVTGTSTPDAALSAIQANPDLAMQFQMKIVDSQVELAQISADLEKAELAADTTQLQTVNQTMQAEDTQHRGYWRDACGYVLALGSLIGVVAVCFLFYQALVNKDSMALSVIPTLAVALTTILSVPGAVVGVKVWHDGKTQQIQAQQGSAQ